jgi:hypothetical protein
MSPAERLTPEQERGHFVAAGEQTARLRGRRAECAALDRVLEETRASRSSVLVVRGESGVGKSVLLDYVAERASGCRVARAGAVESEMELPLAGLQQLLGASMLERVENLPAPQGDALRLAFGLAEGPPPDRFLFALAALSLLSDVADERPLVCIVDDVQWLDRESAQVLSFVARRLDAEPVGMVFAVREPSAVQELAGLPDLVVEGLGEHDARALLAAGIPGGLDEQVRDRIVAETRGNPLALLELPRELTSCGDWRRSRTTRGCCCWPRQRIRLGIRCCCGGRPSGSASGFRRPPRRRRRDC